LINKIKKNFSTIYIYTSYIPIPPTFYLTLLSARQAIALDNIILNF